MNKINAKIVADSIDPRGNRITSYILTYPRMIHSELMTHRMFSRNAASSRAIPFEKMVKMVEEDPFIPIAWQKQHKGMQGTEYITDDLSVQFATSNWLQAANDAIKNAKSLYSDKNGYESITKQLCNRLLEPFMWYTSLVTATEYDNFFELRCPKYFGKYKSWKDACNKGGATDNTSFEYRMNDSQAEIHIQALAEAMWDARNGSTPKELKAGEWHIPFGDKINISEEERLDYSKDTNLGQIEAFEKMSLKVAVARCARLSYMTFDNKIDYEKDIKLHDRLLESKHMSPFEHCARVATEKEYFSNIKGYIGISNIEDIDEVDMIDFDYTDLNSKELGWFNNFRGFIPYRYLIENNHE